MHLLQDRREGGVKEQALATGCIDAPRSLLLTSIYPPTTGGIETYLSGVVSRLPNARVIAPDADGVGDFSSVTRWPRPRLNSYWAGRRARWKTLARLAWAAKRHHADVVHCGLLICDALFARDLRRLTGVPYVVYGYGMELLKARKTEEADHWQRLLLGQADAVISISDYTTQLLADCGAKPERIIKAMPGIDPEPFETAARGAVLPPPDQPVVVSIGRLVERKGVDTLLHAWPQVLAEFPKAQCWIGGDGPEGDRLRRLSHALGVDASVRFLGRVPDEELPLLYAGATVFAMIPRQLGEEDVEGFGIVFLEANAAGRPVVAGRSGGVPDAVAEGESGLLVDPNQPEAVAQALLRLLRDPGYADRLGHQGQARVRACFTKEHTAAAVARALRLAVGRRK